jgi:hypothetical protein
VVARTHHGGLGRLVPRLQVGADQAFRGFSVASAVPAGQRPTGITAVDLCSRQISTRAIAVTVIAMARGFFNGLVLAEQCPGDEPFACLEFGQALTVYLLLAAPLVLLPHRRLSDPE